jgi:predicted phosphoribosyltransferase
MFFENRHDAARQLAPLLKKYKRRNAVILAIPRGGVPIGCYLAKELHLPLDLLMVKKISHPANKEYAIGAVFIEGERIEEGEDLPKNYIQEQIESIRSQLKKRYLNFKGLKKPLDLEGKIVIVVDDGIATGRTVCACIPMLKKKNPAKLIIAAPVVSHEARCKISTQVDDFICLHTPYPFIGVGRFYNDFTQVEDADVTRMLRETEYALVH